MKKLYTILLSAAVALTASAATPTAEHVAKAVSTDFGTLKTWEEVSKSMHHDGATATAKLNVPGLAAKKVAKAPAKVVAAPADITALCATMFDGSYEGMLNNNAGKHEGEAKFTYYTDYEELDLTLPDCANDLYVGYENKKLIIYNGVNYGTNTNGKVVLCPIDSKGQMLTSANVEVPFNEETGKFDFPADFAWGLCLTDASTGSLKGYYWAANKFDIEVSTGDYSLSTVLEAERTSDNKFKLTLDWGADVASVYYAVFPFDADIETFGSNIQTWGTAVTEKGTITIDPVNTNAFNAPMDESDMASVLIATYDASGALKRSAHHGMIVILDSEEGWRKVADVQFNDQIFAQYYQRGHSQAAVLEQSEETPDLYRYVNPYSEHEYQAAKGLNHYFIIDTQDKEWVTIPFCTTGVNFMDGILNFGTCAALGFDKASAQENGLVAGTMEDNKITFPANSIFVHEQYYNEPGTWTRPLKTGIEITLPEVELTLSVVDGNDAPVEGATVTVGETTGTTDATGVATLTLPFETGYFANVTATADKDEKTAEQTVTLTGAKTTATVKIATLGGISGVAADADVNAPVEFFNLQGVRVAHPTEGQLVIRRQGTKVEKVVLK